MTATRIAMHRKTIDDMQRVWERQHELVQESIRHSEALIGRRTDKSDEVARRKREAAHQRRAQRELSEKMGEERKGQVAAANVRRVGDVRQRAADKQQTADEIRRVMREACSAHVHVDEERRTAVQLRKARRRQLGINAHRELCSSVSSKSTDNYAALSSHRQPARFQEHHPFQGRPVRAIPRGSVHTSPPVIARPCQPAPTTTPGKSVFYSFRLE
eukprot:Rhum_TRINITY_DN25997_c0_g1::Rhum_TRINITY_DN25997_c0_g1_i1::g.183130::m.183130